MLPVGAFVISLLVAGCATLESDRLALPPGLPAQVELDAVPFFPQQAFQCGPATLAMALRAADVAATPEALEPQVYIPDKRGSLQPELLAATRRNGRLAYVLQPELLSVLREVAAGQPVIVLQNLAFAWYPKWHYALVVGYDASRGEMILRSGLTPRHVVAMQTFERTWRRAGAWAMVVVAPGTVPATADELAYLQALVDFERQAGAAATAGYQAATRRWPRSLGAWLGLGNRHYAQGERAAAADAYRQAVRHHPQSAVALNNLAQTLADLNQLTEAETVARQAVALGGPWQAAAEETLNAIRQRRGR